MPRDQRRLQLLDVASDIFAEKGFHSAAMDDIAVAAGVSKPVLYQHFPSKLELYQALVDRACDHLVALVGQAIESSSDNRERVSAAIRSFYAFVSESGRSFRFVFESDLTGDPGVQQRIWQVHQDLAERIAALISGDTMLPPEQAELLGMSLVGMAQVSARYWVSEAQDAIPVDQASQLVATLSWGGIRSFPRVSENESGADEEQPH